MGGKNIKTCCVIPAHNEEKAIGRVIEGAKEHLSDVLVVDDGSTDQTATIAAEKGAEVISHKTNMGKGVALRHGFEWALEQGFDAVITIDGDGQHDTAEIPSFLRAAAEGPEGIIIGARLRDKSLIPLYRLLPNKFGVFCISLATGQRIEDSQSGYRLYNSEVLKAAPVNSPRFEAEAAILIKAAQAGFKIRSIPVKAIYPEDYSSHFRNIRDFTRISLAVLKAAFIK